MAWHGMRVKHVPAGSWHSVLAHAGRLHYCRFIPSGSRRTQLLIELKRLCPFGAPLTLCSIATSRCAIEACSPRPPSAPPCTRMCVPLC
jgi:hypothetical protein